MTAESVIWCGHCCMGFALLRRPYPPECPNTACRQPADWREESPTPRTRYNLTAQDMRILRAMRIRPE